MAKAAHAQSKGEGFSITQQAALQRNFPQPWVSGLIMAAAMDVAIAGTLPLVSRK